MATTKLKRTLIPPIKDKIQDHDSKKLVQYMYLTIKPSPNKKYQCWWCTLWIDDQDMLGCPMDMKVTHEIYPGGGGDKKHVYAMDGLFCSFNCVKAFIEEKQRYDFKYETCSQLLSHLYCDLTGKKEPIIIEPSPSRYLLVQYGGFMTSDKYKQNLGKVILKECNITEMYTTLLKQSSQVDLYAVKTIYEENENHVL